MRRGAARIGVVGTDSSHVDHLVRYLNVEHRQGPARVVALAGGATERNLRLAAAGDVEHVADEPEALLGLVDAVLVADRDGGLHRAHAMPFLHAGLPVFVDKPFATDPGDAEAMLAAARRYDAPLTSYSAVRWFPDTVALAGEAAAAGAPSAVLTVGPADPVGPHGGVWFYGVHPVDVALRLAAGPVRAVHAERVPGGVLANARVGDCSVVVHLVRPSAGSVPFHATVVAGTSVLARELKMGERYLDPALDAFFAMVHSGQAPLSDDDMLRPIALLARIASFL